eukprot:802951-Pelagomonas_calceolata.AAC.1
MKAGLQPTTTSIAARTNIECACCRICNYPGGYEPINSEPPYLDMYICDVCQQTDHWNRVKELGCYTEGHRKEIGSADTGACPACAGLNSAHKTDTVWETMSVERMTHEDHLDASSEAKKKLKRPKF